MKYIAFTGGGTGGHIYPGLAVCDELQTLLNDKEINTSFLWIGSSTGMDKSIVEKSGSVDLFAGIPCGKLRRYFSFKNFFDIAKILAGFITSIFILIKYKPLVLFSKGGFVSVPPCYAAKLLHIPVFTHECDFSPGLATKLNTPCAKNILISYEQTKKCFAKKYQHKLIVTGNPVRPVFYTADPNKGIEFIFNNQEKTDLPILLVLGGSSGALQINNLIWDSYEWICEHFFIIHQTGKNIDSQKKIIHPNYKAFEFIYEQMSDVLACCDVILSRAGANSLWEAAVQAKPMILIPLAGSGTRGDQVENAQLFKDCGAAEVLKGSDVSKNGLKPVLLEMVDNNIRTKYSVNAKKMTLDFRPAELIAQLLYKEIGDFLCL